MEFFKTPSFMGNPKDCSFKKQKVGMQAKRQGDSFEEYFKSLLVSIRDDDNSPIVAFRKHSNEVVGILHHKKMFSVIKKLGHLKGDLDFSITTRTSPVPNLGTTVFAECKSGKAILTKEQDELITKYLENEIPFFIFCEKEVKKWYHACIVATRNFEMDKKNIKNLLMFGGK